MSCVWTVRAFIPNSVCCVVIDFFLSSVAHKPHTTRASELLFSQMCIRLWMTVSVVFPSAFRPLLYQYTLLWSSLSVFLRRNQAAVQSYSVGHNRQVRGWSFRMIHTNGLWLYQTWHSAWIGDTPAFGLLHLAINASFWLALWTWFLSPFSVYFVYVQPRFFIIVPYC